ncbi:hypothetical protein OQA88_12653 [Cercophora sp. LCS_1]
MAIIAVAGGTGNVGRAIVDAILATRKHQVFILSRKANAALSAEIGATILAVDYTSIPSIVSVLEANNIDTVISGIAMHSEDGSTPNEIELIRAADASKTTKRMISSEWGIPVKEENVGAIPSVLHKLNAKNELAKTTSLEYTSFHNGYFMDYWGFQGVSSYLSRVPLVFWVDIANNKAAIPGSGNTPIVFTHTTDVAKFVAASLDLPKWENETFIRGDTVTWNEFVKLAEEVKGTKFEVVYDDVEQLKRGESSELPAQVPLYQFIPKQFLSGMAAAMGLWTDQGLFDMKPEKWLNEEVEIETLKVKEMLEKAWK